MTTPNFESMTRAELRAHALKYRDDITPLRILFSRRRPNAPKYSFPDTEEGRAQMMDLLCRKLEEAEAKNQQQPETPDDPSD
jgi:hypothetical protein